MIHEVLKLREYFPDLPGDYPVTLTTYCHDQSPQIDRSNRPSILVCPGGGYEFTSDREAEPVALHFMAMGFNTFVLRYGVKPAIYPEALLESAASIAYIRSHAATYDIDRDKIAIMGFSAGGHLAASLGIFWKEPFIARVLHVEQDAVRPNAMVLCYPVITSGKFAHKGSFNALLGGELNTELVEKMSLEKQVSADTPPAFIWHTYEDPVVPVENALYFAASLRQKKIPFELHIFPKGCHGLSLCNEETASSAPHLQPHCAQWAGLCEVWLKTTFGK